MRSSQGSTRRSAAGLSPVKLNTVVLRGVNDDELERLLLWAWRRRMVPRFLEVMPIAEGAKLVGKHLVTAAEMTERLAAHLATGDAQVEPGKGPAKYIRARHDPSLRVGFITGTSDTFCASCDRLRVSSTGTLRPCLATDDGRRGGERSDRGRRGCDRNERLAKPGRSSPTARFGKAAPRRLRRPSPFAPSVDEGVPSDRQPNCLTGIQGLFGAGVRVNPRPQQVTSGRQRAPRRRQEVTSGRRRTPRRRREVTSGRQGATRRRQQVMSRRQGAPRRRQQVMSRRQGAPRRRQQVTSGRQEEPRRRQQVTSRHQGAPRRGQQVTRRRLGLPRRRQEVISGRQASTETTAKSDPRSSKEHRDDGKE